MSFNQQNSFVFLILIFISILMVVNTQISSNNNKDGEKFVKRSPKTTLYYSKECQTDIIHNCPRAIKSELNDLAVLQCIHNQVADFNQLSKECNNLLYEVKKNFTTNLRLDDNVLEVCKDELTQNKKLAACKSVESDNGHLSSCLIENKEEVEDLTCKEFLTNIAALVFSDYHLIYNFMTDCESDIKRLECGRLEKKIQLINNSEAAPTQQGKTIECLSRKFQDLDNKCKKQIVRVTELQSDDFHLDRTLFFACRDDRERLCERISSGNGRVYKCLMKQKFNQLMSRKCQAELTRRQKIIIEDYASDRSMVIACKNDIIKYECRKDLRYNNNTEMYQMASVILCLETAIRDGNEVDTECRAELIDHRKMLLSDYQLNPNVVKYCAYQIKEYCNGLQRNGKTLHCLLNNMVKLKNQNKDSFNSKCFQELHMLIKVADAAEDVRVDEPLMEACENLITGPCKNVPYGKGRVINCLIKFIGTPQINDDCEERLLEIQFFVARDWTLNPALYEACKSDAVKFCHAKNLWNDWSTDVENGPLILPCLFHKLHEDDPIDKLNNKCAIEIEKVMIERAKSIDLHPEIQDECSYDLANSCSKTKMNVKGEEIRCLQKNFKELQDNCKEAIKKYSIDESKDIRLDQILMNSCLPTIEEFCTDKKEEKGALLECLIEQKDNPKMHEKCKIGIQHHQLLNLEKVEFNLRFKKYCEKEIKQHCSQTQSKLEAIHCLSELVLNDTLLDRTQSVHSTCRKQLRFELVQMNENIELDPDLALACKNDVKNLCIGIKPGKGQILECLRSKRNELEPKCKNKLFKRDKINLIEQDADFSLKRECKNTIKQYCHEDDEDENGAFDKDILSCLRKHLGKPDLEPTCRSIIIERLITQNEDFRLNPGLWKACNKDVEKKCSQEFLDSKDLNQNLHGRAIKCLKKEFVKETLSRQCSILIEEVMREAAIIDYRLDPLLVDNCMTELQKFCVDEPNDKKENCLRLKFQNRMISQDSRCFEEVRRIIIEGAADVFVDHELSQICSIDLAKYCNNIAPGASQQLKCLLGIKNSKETKLSEGCEEILSTRRELWNMAQISETLSGVNDLARLINESEHRSYLFFILFTIFTIIFALGCLCRPAVFKARRDKRK